MLHKGTRAPPDTPCRQTATELCSAVLCLVPLSHRSLKFSCPRELKMSTVMSAARMQGSRKVAQVCSQNDTLVCT